MHVDIHLLCKLERNCALLSHGAFATLSASFKYFNPFIYLFSILPWEFCTVCFDCIHLQLLPESLPKKKHVHCIPSPRLGKGCGSQRQWRITGNIWAQQDSCTLELRVIVRAQTKPVQAWARLNSSVGRKLGHTIPPSVVELLTRTIRYFSSKNVQGLWMGVVSSAGSAKSPVYRRSLCLWLCVHLQHQLTLFITDSQPHLCVLSACRALYSYACFPSTWNTVLHTLFRLQITPFLSYSWSHNALYYVYQTLLSFVALGILRLPSYALQWRHRLKDLM